MYAARARVLATLLLILSAGVGQRVGALALSYLVSLTLVASAGRLRQHLGVVLIALAPVGIGSAVVWGMLVGAPPGAPPHTDPAAGLAYAAAIALRLGAVASAVQWFSAIPGDQLVACLRVSGARGSALTVVAGALAIVPEIRLRSLQVLSARQARGLAGASRLALVTTLPFLLRPLTAWSLRSAIHRADTWRQRGLLQRMEAVDTRELLDTSSQARRSTTLAVGLAAAALAVSLATR